VRVVDTVALWGFGLDLLLLHGLFKSLIVVIESVDDL
jgi:hypothetical protein